MGNTEKRAENIDDLLIKVIMADQGFNPWSGDAYVHMMQQYVTESVVPGACRACTHVVDSCEPDARDNWCPRCNSSEVASVLVLMGVM